MVDVLRRLTLRVSEQRILPCCLTWLPDGQRFAFVSNVSSSPEIYVADLADWSALRLTDNRWFTDNMPVWRP